MEKVDGMKRNELSVVAQDTNWRSYVSNELACAERWHADWGFLTSGDLEGKCGKKDSASPEL